MSSVPTEHISRELNLAQTGYISTFANTTLNSAKLEHLTRIIT